MNTTLVSNTDMIKNLKIAIIKSSNDLSNNDLFIAMNRIACQTKGFHFIKVYKSFSYDISHYQIMSDYDTLVNLSNTHGYWSSLVQDFNQKLIHKGGESYKSDINCKYLATLK